MQTPQMMGLVNESIVDFNQDSATLRVCWEWIYVY
jgi:hypothetical protein